MTDLNQAADSFRVERGTMDSFRTRGHVRVHSVATPNAVESVRSLIVDIVREQASSNNTQGRVEEYSKIFTQVTNVWRMNEQVRQFIFARRFAQLAAQLMGVSKVRLYHDQALFKSPGGNRTPWHQDQFYWPLDTPNMLTMWMPLIDINPAMGTMLFVDGSHLKGKIGDGPISDSTEKELEAIIKDGNYPVTEYGDFRAGDATFHSGWTVHAAYPNTSNTTREVLTIIYYADGAKLLQPDSEYREADMRAFFPGQKPGETAGSSINPLLYAEQP